MVKCNHTLVPAVNYGKQYGRGYECNGCGALWVPYSPPQANVLVVAFKAGWEAGVASENSSVAPTLENAINIFINEVIQ